MITKYATAPDKSGNILQMVIDDEAQTVKAGYFLFVGSPDRQIEKSVIRKIQAATNIPEKKRAFFTILSLIGG